MAKYSRFDSRNKKIGRHKSHSLDKDFKIKRAETENKRVHCFSDVVEYDYNEGEYYDRQLKQGNPHRL